MTDPIIQRFRERQLQEGMKLAADSDLFDLTPIGGPIPERYLARFYCRGMVREGDRIVEADRFDVGIWFGDNYLRQASTFEALTWLGPANCYHPNIDPTRHLICIGALSAGTSLVDIIYQIHEVITYRKLNPTDPLVIDPCGWARHNQDRFPVDDRPLKRRVGDLELEVVA